jgi:hypothetical protein
MLFEKVVCQILDTFVAEEGCSRNGSKHFFQHGMQAMNDNGIQPVLIKSCLQIQLFRTDF